jgi:hypothetical protein
MNVAAEPIQLGYGDLTLELLGSGKGGLELRAAVECIGALAGFDLNELSGQLQPFSLCELPKYLALGFEPKP